MMNEDRYEQDDESELLTAAEYLDRSYWMDRAFAAEDEVARLRAQVEAVKQLVDDPRFPGWWAVKIKANLSNEGGDDG
jgi:hypothetical protein